MSWIAKPTKNRNNDTSVLDEGSALKLARRKPVMLNLILAAIWCSIGGILLLWEWSHPEAGQWSIRGTGISFGWLALLLGLYNLARWWSRKLSKTNDQAWQTVRSSQHQRLHSDSRPVDSKPDPNFIFTDQSTESTAEH